MASFLLFAIFFFSAIIFFTLLVLTWLIFGKLISLQIKRWLLASKGYVEVEHVSATKVRNYFILKPKENKFDIDDGFFHYIPECITKKGDIIRKMDKAYFSKVPDIDPSELEGLSDKEQESYKQKVLSEWTELKNLYKAISNMKYDPEQLNRKMGMPVITYYADNPDPMNFSNREKVYGSGVIKDMYLRLLLTQRYKDFQLIVMVMLIVGVVLAIAVFGLWRVHLADAKNYQLCLNMFNQTNTQLIDLANQTIQSKMQSSTIVVS